MKITTVMVVILLLWSVYTLMRGHYALPPSPWPPQQNLHFSDDALGWLKGSDLPTKFGLLGIMIAFGHSLLAVMIIPDEVRGNYKDNMISGMALYLAGPYALKLIFKVFVVFVGFLML